LIFADPKRLKVQFDRIVLYLREEWTEKEVDEFRAQLKNFERIVVKFPELYGQSKKNNGLRRAALSKHNSVIYKVDTVTSLIRVYTIFDNRQHPDKLK